MSLIIYMKFNGRYFIILVYVYVINGLNLKKINIGVII